MMKKIVTVFMTVSMILAMVPLGMAVDSSATVNNMAPVVTNKAEAPNPADPGTTVTITALISDGNGLDDITSVTYTSDLGNGNLELNTETGVATGTLFISSIATPGSHAITVTAEDVNGGTGDQTNNLEVNEKLALSISFDSVNFPNVDPDGTVQVTPGNINNEGNVLLDVKETATWSAPASGFITEGKVGIVGPQVIDTPGSTFDVDISVSGSTPAIFSLYVPLGTDPIGYTGSITIEAVTV